MKYQKIMIDLALNFGKFGYFNDKRKTFRRIKITGPKPKLAKIEKFLKSNYPELEVGNTLKDLKKTRRGLYIDPVTEFYSGVTIKFPF
jgi:hypothetical protein